MKIILINGCGGVGKDSFIRFCQKNYHGGFIWNISTISLIKEAAIILGWTGEKDERSRKFLSDLKDLATSYSDISIKFIQERINSAKMQRVDFMFVHVREPKEIEKLKEKFSATTLLIRNNRVPTIESNHADRDVENYRYDFIIENNGTLEELEEKACNFLTKL